MRFLLIFVLALGLVGCSKRVTFHVDVPTGANETTRVEQSVKFKRVSTGPLALGIGWAIDTTRVRIPDGSTTIEWESSLMPMIVVRGTGPVRWTLVASPISCDDFYRFRSPQPPYVQFDYVDGKWNWHAMDPKWNGHRSSLLVSPETALESGRAVMNPQAINRLNSPVSGVSERYAQVIAAERSNCRSI